VILPDTTLELTSFHVNSAVPVILDQYIFVFTGILQGVSCEEAQEMVPFLGGRVTGSVSGKTDYSVSGDEMENGLLYTEGSKYKRALKEAMLLIRGEEALFGLMKQYNDKALAQGKQAPEKKASPPGSTQTSAAAAPVAAAKPVNPYARSVASNPYARKNPYAKKAASSTTTMDQKPAAAASTTTSLKKSVSTTNTNINQLWVDKYRPLVSREILGNQDAVRKLSLWLASWEQRFNNPTAAGKSFSAPNGPWKAALLSGPPGIGSK
jgi:replication factor C subunit 1